MSTSTYSRPRWWRGSELSEADRAGGGTADAKVYCLRLRSHLRMMAHQIIRKSCAITCASGSCTAGFAYLLDNEDVEWCVDHGDYKHDPHQPVSKELPIKGDWAEEVSGADVGLHTVYMSSTLIAPHSFLPTRLNPNFVSKYVTSNPTALPTSSNLSLVPWASVPYTSMANPSPSWRCFSTKSSSGGFSK